ncbi:MAG: hypothetical protein ACLFTR_03090 [Candidatus Woesearchaeota archaeon]
MYRVGKKAQITVFIIVGLFIVATVTGFLMFRESELRESFIQQESGIVQEKVGSTFVPVQDFVNTCLETVTRDAVERVGRHGGYVSTEELDANRADPTSPRSNSIHYWPRDESFKIAYWWHMTSEPFCHLSDSCEFASHMPPLDGGSPDAVDAQIEGFVEENINSCISGFSGFASQGFDFDVRDEPEADVTIARDNLVVSMDYPFEASYESQSETMERFSASLDIDLRKLWEIGETIANIQKDGAPFEVALLEMIALYSGTGPDALLPPPYSSIAMKREDRKFAWTRSEIKNSMMSMLSSYIPMFSVVESGNFALANVDSGIDTAVFDSMIFSVDTIENPTRYDINFDYRSWWDLYLNIGDSEMLKPEDMEMPVLSDIPGVGAIMDQAMPSRYHFTYDVSFPVLVSIRDRDAFNEDGFIMNLALETNVRSNTPASPGDEMNNLSAMSGDNPFGGSRMCRSNNLDVEDLKLTVVDSVTGEEIDGVAVEYVCGRESCFLGNTESHSDGTYFKGDFPACMGGILELSARDYGPKEVEMSLESGEAPSIPEIELDPVTDVDVRVKVLGNIKSSGNWHFDHSEYYPLREAESVMLNINKVSGSQNDDFSSIAYLEGDTTSTISLVPGEYEVTGQLTLDTSYDGYDQIVIPEEEEEVSSGPFGIGKETEELPEIPFDDLFPEGMVLLDESHGGNWEVTAEDLEEGKVTFYVIASPYIPDGGVDLDYDDLDEFGKADYYSKDKRNFVEPCFGDFSEGECAE